MDATAPAQTLEGIGPAYGERLAGAGVTTIADLLAVDAEHLADAVGVAPASPSREASRPSCRA